MKNEMPEGFLQKYRNGKRKEVKYIPLKLGFLKLEYDVCDNPGILSLVSFVLEDNDEAMAVGPRLEMNLTPDATGDVVTFITENGVSGLQWSNGRVFWGHTYDDDSPPSEGKTISLEEWIDECVDKMINPDDDEIAERKRLDRE
ncbi:MAG: hypothetical protein JW827_07600 [Spirochaetes bacterium]|nr:hypothetical protein [Spirochaetota bacterium]